MLGQRPATGAKHLQGALYALRVVGVNAYGGRWIDASQFRVQKSPAMPGCFILDLTPNGLVGRWQAGQAMYQAMEIQHGASRKDGQPAPPGDVLHQAQRIPLKSAGGVALGRIEDVYQMMRNALALLQGGFGRADVHPLENQCGIDADDLTVERLSQFDRQAGFS